MNLSTPPPLAVVGLNGSDEEAIMFLGMLSQQSPLPETVIELNLYQYEPYNLPEGFWFLVSSTEKKKTEFGFWRQKEPAREFRMNTCISIGRTTLEYVEIKDGREQITDWVTLEYKLKEKGPQGTNIEKESRAICKVFHSGGMNSNWEDLTCSREAATSHRNGVHSEASVVPRSATTLNQDSASMVTRGGDAGQLVSEANRHLDPQTRGISALPYILEGDYLELDDLVYPLSDCTTSDNSSRTSLTWDDYFDPVALIQELENATRTDQSRQGRDSNSRFNVCASVQPVEVVIQPPSSGSLVRASGSQPEPAAGCIQPSSTSIPEIPNTGKRVADLTVKKLNEKKGDSSSSVGEANEKPAAGAKMKRLKKYFCLMPF